MLFTESCAEANLLGTVWWGESKVGIGRMHGEVPIEHLGDEFRLTGRILSMTMSRNGGTPRSASSQSSSSMPGG